jgi:peptide/nickel transport system ATP-binding protein
MSKPTLEIHKLSVHYPGSPSPALRDFSLSIEPGTCVAIMGRSGAGKSSFLLALQGLLGEPVSLVSGRVRLDGQELFGAGDFSKDQGSRAHRAWLQEVARGLRATRGRAIATLFQEPRAALDPYASIGAQLEEAARLAAQPLDARALLEVLELPARVLGERPDALSLGMCQRVQLGLALAAKSRVLLADEPLSRIDPRGRGRMVRILEGLMSEGLAIVLVTHDPSLADRLSREMIVLHRGFTVARGPTRAMTSPGIHPLLEAPRRAWSELRAGRRALQFLSPEDAGESPAEQRGGCPLQSFCWARSPDCRSAPEVASPRLGVESLCSQGAESWPERVRVEAMGPRAEGLAHVELRSVDRSFETGGLWRRRRVQALRGLELSIYENETLALVGESGGGKSTLAALLVGLFAPQRGEVLDSQGASLPALGSEARLALTRRAQLTLQESDQAMDPSVPVGEVLAAAWLQSWSGINTSQARGLARALAAELALGEEVLDRVASKLSGGERKRAVIARALAALGWGLDHSERPLEPGLLLLDEPLSGLDPELQARTAALLMRARRELRLALLFISHDLPMARAFADRLAVMTGGRLVELLDDPRGRLRHPFSRQLEREDAPKDLAAIAPPETDPCVFFERCDSIMRGPRCQSLTFIGPAPGIACIEL